MAINQPLDDSGVCVAFCVAAFSWLSTPLWFFFKAVLNISPLKHRNLPDHFTRIKYSKENNSLGDIFTTVRVKCFAQRSNCHKLLLSVPHMVPHTANAHSFPMCFCFCVTMCVYFGSGPVSASVESLVHHVISCKGRFFAHLIAVKWQDAVQKWVWPLHLGLIRRRSCRYLSLIH